MARRGLETARRMISAFAEEDFESWMADHASAMECLDIEDLLRWAQAIRGVIERIVEADEEKPDGDEDSLELIEELHRSWLVVSRRILVLITEFERSGFRVEGAEAFIADVKNAENRLARLEREAVVEARMGFRGVRLSPEAAAQLLDMINRDSAETSSEHMSPKAVPTVDVSIIVKNR